MTKRRKNNLVAQHKQNRPYMGGEVVFFYIVGREKRVVKFSSFDFQLIMTRAWLMPTAVSRVLLSVVLKEVFEVCTWSSACGR